MQTDVLKKDFSAQCSLLPAPPLCFSKTNLQPLPEVHSTEEEMDTEEATTELDESDADYFNDVTESVEG